MNCGYDPRPDGIYDTAPVAPQMWHAYHITGEIMAMQIVVALTYRKQTGRGQVLTSAVHDAVSKNTETDFPDWVYSRLPHNRMTCRHSFGLRKGATAKNRQAPGPVRTKDGRWVLPYSTYFNGFGTPVSYLGKVLANHGMEGDLFDEKYNDPAYLALDETAQSIDSKVARYIESFTFDADLWKEGQAVGMPWAPLRRPEENIDDPHFSARGTFVEVDQPEIGRSVTEVGARWYSPEVPWVSGVRAPRLDEHTADVLAEWAVPTTKDLPSADVRETRALSKRGKPFALDGVRVLDLTWFLASAGAGRYLAAHGADVIKVEHMSRLDGVRRGVGLVGDGGREARDEAVEPTPLPTSGSVNRSGFFMDINSGKRSISLNLKSDEGREILRELIRDADMLVEGFSPGTMEKMGLGYEEMRKINPDIIYVQQSGMGQHGTYQRMRSFGPTGQAISGLSEMSGYPEPYAPAGIGYSYLDWFGAYNMATAMIAALYRRDVTGQGCWVDSSQAEIGIYLTGTAVLDHSVNGRAWARYGNRSPYQKAAPHGVYPGVGEDRWIAFGAFDDEQWLALTRVLAAPELANDARFANLESRLAHQEELDRLVASATAQHDVFALMDALQAAGVPAGVCQTMQDRFEDDPQLAHLNWLVDLEQSEIGTWPVKELPVTFSETPPYVGGPHDRHGPSYAEDNAAVYGGLLGKSPDEIAALARDGVI